jgi:hypothetical protein
MIRVRGFAGDSASAGAASAAALPRASFNISRRSIMAFSRGFFFCQLTLA